MEKNYFENEELVFNMIQGQIGYEFKNLDLLKQAFTRRSYTEEHGGENNEVLELIGDRVLDLVVLKLLISQNSNSEGLFKKFDNSFINSWSYIVEEKNLPKENTFISDYSEAKITEIKKKLVQKKTLAMRIDELGFSQYMIMGRGDILQNLNEENSVKEDLFEAILGAVAIDCNWNMEKLQNAVEVMLAPETIIDEGGEDNYVSLIQEWSHNKINGVPLYRFGGRISIWNDSFEGISQSARSIDEKEQLRSSNHHCLLKISDALPIFRGFGKSQTEARINVCKVAYEYLCEEGLWLSICDEIENPNKEDAVNQLEILARRGYFSIPTYDFEQTYDNNGNPIWKSICHIAEESKNFSARSSSKKDAKKSAAFKMLQYVLNN